MSRPRFLADDKIVRNNADQMCGIAKLSYVAGAEIPRNRKGGELCFPAPKVVGLAVVVLPDHGVAP